MNHISRAAFKKFISSVFILLLFNTLSAFVSDVLITNYSFENGLTGWTATNQPVNGNGSASVVAEQAHEGNHSLKLVDNDPAAGFGVESTRVPCIPGEVYTAFARIRIQSGASEIQLRFWNGSTLLAARAIEKVAGPLNRWQSISAQLKAPEHATHLSVMLYSAKQNKGAAFWDEVLISGQQTDLGMQVYDSSPNGTTFGIGVNAHLAYSVVVGNNKTPPVMMVIDTNTGLVLQSVPFPSGATGAWAAATASNGDTYFGTYSDGGVYRYVPGQIPNKSLIRVANAGESIIYDLAAGVNGEIYGGTYGNAKLFSYHPDSANKVVQIDSKPFVPGTQYVRALTHDPVNKVTYLSVGIGTGATGIYRYHQGLKEKVKILPVTGLASAMNFTGDRLFVFISGSARVLRITAKKDGSFLSADQEAVFSSKGHVSPAVDGKVYYFTAKGNLSVYDISSKTSAVLNGLIGADAYVKRLAWVNNQVVGIVAQHNQTFIVKYDPSSPASFQKIRLTESVRMPGALNEIQAGPDGKIYTSAYLTGGLGVYTPMRGDAYDSREDTMFSPISQIDRMGSYNGKLYIGAYPGATLYEYDPAQPWATGANPKPLVSGARAPYFQDRPKAITGVSTPNGNYVFMASAAQTGKFNGGLAWYNMDSHASGNDSIVNQSAISLAAYGSQLFVGTSIRRGYATSPGTASSSVLVYNITPNGIEYSTTLALPVTNLKSITKMLVADKKIWGFADGYIFVLNPETKKFESCELKFPWVSYGTGGTYRDADMFILPQDPDHIYGTIGGKLIRISRKTMEPETILAGADKATFDSFGNIYYSLPDKSRLGRYVISKR